MDFDFTDVLERHELSSEQRTELTDQLANGDATELRKLLAWLADRHPDAARLIRLRTLDDGEQPDVDADDIRHEIEQIVAPISGAFGRPDCRGDHAFEADFKALARRGRDYETAGYLDAARTVYSAVIEGLRSHNHLFNPHRGWHRTLEEALLTQLEQIDTD